MSSWKRLQSLVALGMLTGISPTQAKDAYWVQFAYVCQDLLPVQEVASFTQSARAWERQETATQGSLTKLAKETCPAYLQNANAALGVGAVQSKGSVTLKQYVSAQTQTFGDALTANADGKSRQAYLKAQYDRLRATLGRYGVNLDSTLCGKLITERYKFIKGELDEVAQKTDGVRTTCPKIASAMEADSLAKGPRPARYGQGSSPRQPMRGPASNPKQGSSTITGEIHRDNLGGKP